MPRFVYAALVVAVTAGTLVSPVASQEVPAGPGEPGARPPGGRLERVEILGKQSSDNELRRRAQIAKQIYGRDELDRHGDTNLADVLQRLPGITMQGNQPRMRGLGTGYTLVLINGDPAPPGFALDQLDPAQVERIEVTKGPVASQSAQAVAGAINRNGRNHRLRAGAQRCQSVVCRQARYLGSAKARRSRNTALHCVPTCTQEQL